MVLDEIEELLPKSLADFQFGAREHFPVFGNNSGGNVQPGRFGDRKQEDGALESVRFEGRRDDNICVDHQPERDHPRLVFSARAALMAWSICREVSLSVPLRCDSSPITRSTSGSGAARRT